MRVKHLVEILLQQDQELPLIVMRDSKGDHFGLDREDVGVVDGAYFGNDLHSREEFEADENFLLIGIV